MSLEVIGSVPYFHMSCYTHRVLLFSLNARNIKVSDQQPILLQISPSPTIFFYTFESRQWVQSLAFTHFFHYAPYINSSQLHVALIYEVDDLVISKQKNDMVILLLLLLLYTNRNVLIEETNLQMTQILKTKGSQSISRELMNPFGMKAKTNGGLMSCQLTYLDLFMWQTQ